MNTRNAVIRVGRWEGVSFLVLLLVAMPLKYWAGVPMAVKVVGWLHGGLFVAYVGTVFWAHSRVRWSVTVLVLLLLASLVPLGPFFVERRLPD